MKALDEMTTGGRIRIARVQKGLQQKQLAQSIGIAPNYLGTIERGIRTCSDVMYHKIADKLGVSYQWIMDGSMPPDVEDDGQNSSNTIEEKENPKNFFILKENITNDKEIIQGILPLSSMLMTAELIVGAFFIGREGESSIFIVFTTKRIITVKQDVAWKATFSAVSYPYKNIISMSVSKSGGNYDSISIKHMGGDLTFITEKSMAEKNDNTISTIISQIQNAIL